MTGKSPASIRGELLLVIAIVVVVALYVRWDAIPVFPDRHIAGFEETYGVNVGDPGPWFSAWALGDGQAYALIGIDPTGQTLAEGSARRVTGSPGRATAGQRGLSPWGNRSWFRTPWRSWERVGVAVLGLAIRLRPALGPRIG
jgi:hypothetical protein